MSRQRAFNGVDALLWDVRREVQRAAVHGQVADLDFTLREAITGAQNDAFLDGYVAGQGDLHQQQHSRQDVERERSEIAAEEAPRVEQ